MNWRHNNDDGRIIEIIHKQKMPDQNCCFYDDSQL